MPQYVFIPIGSIKTRQSSSIGEAIKEVSGAAKSKSFRELFHALSTHRHDRSFCGAILQAAEGGEKVALPTRCRTGMAGPVKPN